MKLAPLFLLLAFVLTSCIDEKKEILLGQSCALSGPSKELGVGVKNGANAWFNFVNENGGVGGKKIKLISLDDSYEPRVAKANATKLIEKDGVFALFGFVGTPTTYEAISVVKESKVPFVAPITGASFLYQNYSDEVVTLRKSYTDELDLLLRYLKSKNMLRIAIFYQNDSFGKTTLESARKKAKEIGVEIISEGSYTRNTLSIGHALYEIVPTAPDAVVMIDAYKPASYFIKRAREQGLNALFAHLSFVNSDSLQKELGKDQLHDVLVVQVTDEWIDKEYQEVMSRYFPNERLSYASYEGFLSAKAVTEALKKVKKLNRKEFVKELKKELSSHRTLHITHYKNGLFVSIDE